MTLLTLSQVGDPCCNSATCQFFAGNTCSNYDSNVSTNMRSRLHMRNSGHLSIFLIIFPITTPVWVLNFVSLVYKYWMYTRMVKYGTVGENYQKLTVGFKSIDIRVSKTSAATTVKWCRPRQMWYIRANHPHNPNSLNLNHSHILIALALMYIPPNQPHNPNNLNPNNHLITLIILITFILTTLMAS